MPASKVNSSSIFTTALRFSASEFPSGGSTTGAEDDSEDEELTPSSTKSASRVSQTGAIEVGAGGDDDAGFESIEPEVTPESLEDALDDVADRRPRFTLSLRADEDEGVPYYTSPIQYSVSKTGYYCVGE